MRDKSPEIGAVEARREDYFDRHVETREPLRDLESVDVRQLHIEKNEIGTVGVRLFDPRFARVRLSHDDEPMALEQVPRDSPEVGVVVDDEKTNRHQTIVPAHG